MKKHPDLTSLGYRIDHMLEQKSKGGLITWKGTCLNNQKIVIIKQFSFSKANSSWNGYEAYEQELEILKDLRHPQIPSYLGSVETEDGFCLIQEYVNAENLYHFRSLTLTEIKKLTIQLLDILVYLQERSNPILHRDIKPENILLDKNLNPYLIDFGFACFFDQELSNASIFIDPSVFSAPEQITKPTLSSDLYSLGITLVYLLTDQDILTSSEFSMVENPAQLELKKLLPSLEQSFFDWLNVMTQSEVNQRFASASSARNELLFFDPQIGLTQLEGETSHEAVQFAAPKILGTSGIVLTTMIATWSISFVEQQITLTFTTIAIAMVAVLAICISQLGAISIAKLDQQTRFSGLALNMVTSTVLVSVSSLIWGMEEAVIIVTAMTIAEILILAGFWWQIPGWPAKNTLVKFSSLTGAIILGISLGFQLT